MRLGGFVFVLALLASPLSVSAQAEESEEAPEQAVEQEPAPSSEPAPEEPALQLKLDAAGVDVTPSPPRTADGYTLEEMELRVKRAGIGMGVSLGSILIGGGLAIGALGRCGTDLSGRWTTTCNRLAWSGVAVASAGAVALIATGILYGVRQRKRRTLRRRYPIPIPASWSERTYGTPRRVQWDLAQWRLVF